MSLDGKIQSLNNAIREALPSMKQVAGENPNANVLVRSLRFSHGADWHIPNATPVNNFQWRDLAADPLQKPKLDIVFLVDTSGSMSGEINGVKSSCLSFADRIIREGADVRLGLVGFDIGGHLGSRTAAYTVHNLSTYTIGVWPLTSPQDFKNNVQSLSLGLFGGGGCYLANQDTVDIFPHVVRTFGMNSQSQRSLSLFSSFLEQEASNNSDNSKILVIISDEIGNTSGLSNIVSQLKSASITTHVLGVPGRSGAHESIARMTGGEFWDITRSKGEQDFSGLLGTVADTIAREVTRRLADGTVSQGTDMGTALQLVADQMKIPPMTDRALPPVLVLLSDGQPTDDFQQGLDQLMAQPWGKKAVRIAIAIGSDADLNVLQKFIGHSEIRPLQANNPETLTRYIKWASTAVLKAASSPASQAATASGAKVNVPIVTPPTPEPSSVTDVW
ncbi:MAG: VWA domain-containing protein [Symploca sp. SIO2G7]|nr:VWA domain-containing protein [Symploca sp. SIO2G7]